MTTEKEFEILTWMKKIHPDFITSPEQIFKLAQIIHDYHEQASKDEYIKGYQDGWKHCHKDIVEFDQL
jgi:hypothetical protein